VQAFEGGNVLLHPGVLGHALLARQPEPYGLQPLKHVPVLWVACELKGALALSGVPKEIGFDHQFVAVVTLDWLQLALALPSEGKSQLGVRLRGASSASSDV
jgi:hypothetical protein